MQEAHLGVIRRRGEPRAEHRLGLDPAVALQLEPGLHRMHLARHGRFSREGSQRAIRTGDAGGRLSRHGLREQRATPGERHVGADEAGVFGN